MTLEEFTHQISELSRMVRELAEKSCTNIVSENFVYVLSQIDINEGGNAFSQRAKRIKENDLKEAMNLEDAGRMLYKHYIDLYDVNIFIHRSETNRTIIDLRYVLKSSFEQEYKRKISQNDPMFHAKLSIPPMLENNEKFDVNWEHEMM